MHKYKVIWFDDEFESLNIIREKAYLNNIELIGFTNAKQGIDELERNLVLYDAAILDGIFYLSSEQIGNISTDKALLNVAMAIERLASKKQLPWFILSGQISFTKETNRYADGLKNNQVFDKLNNNDLEQLWQVVKTEANKLPDLQLKHKYTNVFELCENKYLGEKHFERLMAIIKSIEQNETQSNIEDTLNPFRKLIESAFIKLGDLGLVPQNILKNKGWINGSSLFLSNRHICYRFTEEIIHPAAAENIYRLLNMIQDASHGEGDLKLRINEYLQTRNNDYLYRSAAFLLFDILAWLKEFIDQYPNIEENKKLWYELDTNSETGIIEQDGTGNYHCGKVLITYKHINDNNYKLGDEIKLTKIVDNTNSKTLKLFSKSLLESEKLN